MWFTFEKLVIIFDALQPKFDPNGPINKGYGFINFGNKTMP